MDALEVYVLGTAGTAAAIFLALAVHQTVAVVKALRLGFTPWTTVQQVVTRGLLAGTSLLIVVAVFRPDYAPLIFRRALYSTAFLVVSLGSLSAFLKRWGRL